MCHGVHQVQMQRLSSGGSVSEDCDACSRKSPHGADRHNSPLCAAKKLKPSPKPKVLTRVHSCKYWDEILARKYGVLKHVG